MGGGDTGQPVHVTSAEEGEGRRQEQQEKFSEDEGASTLDAFLARQEVSSCLPSSLYTPPT